MGNGKDRRWRKYRELFLNQWPLCARCERPAEHVDHIVRAKPKTEEFWNTFNHQPLCSTCHGQKTRKEAVGRYHFIDRDMEARRAQVQASEAELAEAW